MTTTVVLVLFGGILIALGVLLAAVFRHAGRDSARRGIEVSALVVGAVADDSEPDPIYGGGGGGFAPLVRFSTRDGVRVEAGSRHVFGPRHRLPPAGTTVRVRYDPGDPHDIYFPGWDAPARFTAAVMVAAGVVVAIAGAYLVYLGFTVT